VSRRDFDIVLFGRAGEGFTIRIES
jgi:hypothetical protein